MLIESLIAHILGDFYFQSQDMADQKKTNKKVLLHHFENYGWATVLFFLVIITWNRDLVFVEWLLTLLLVICGHTGVDYFLKPILDRIIHKLCVSSNHPRLVTIHPRNQETFVFMLDQLLHVSVLFFIQWLVSVLPSLVQWVCIVFLLSIIGIFLVKIYQEQSVLNTLKQLVILLICFYGVAFLSIYLTEFVLFHPLETEFFIAYFISINEYDFLMSILITLLLLLKPINIIIRKLSSNFDPKGFQTVDTENMDQIDLENQEFHMPGFKGAGAMIGNLERLLILLSFFSGEFIPVVAILSIKAFARYKLIVEDAFFAEYFVIGTMLSVLFTLGCYILLQHLLIM